MNSRRDFLALFIVALCLGATAKILVRDRLTIGYNDYMLPRDTVFVDLNQLELMMIDRGTVTPSTALVPTGETCSETEEY